MRCHLYDAAGNRILWLDVRERNCGTDYRTLERRGLELSRRFEVGQEITAVLFGTSHTHEALFWNPDGSQEKVCGNALRCLAHFVSDDPPEGGIVSVKTASAAYISRRIDATHGAVIMPGRSIHVLYHDRPGEFLVDVGTPHRIRVVAEEWLEHDVAEAVASSTGPAPVNFSLVHRLGPRAHRVRIFERGVGETASCGTAAVSIVAALNERARDAAEPFVHRVEFDSGMELTVAHDPALGIYEIGGAVELLRVWSE